MRTHAAAENVFRIVVPICLFLSIYAAEALAQKRSYKLVWSDEFNYTGRPDPKKWDHELGFIRNEEPQLYQPENATVNKGLLTIEARKERKRNPFYDPDSADWRFNREFAEYTSSSLITKGKFEFKYGRAVLRAKIDTSQGQWPAFWMMGVSRGSVLWPAFGEVDIMEYYRGKMHANVIWEGETSVTSNTQFVLTKDLGRNWQNKFHIWQMDWDADSIKIYMDGKLLNNTDLSKTVNAKAGNNPFREKFYLLVNLALGQGRETIPDETLPARFLVDYVRVYSKSSDL